MRLPIHGLPSVRQPVSSGIYSKDVAAIVQREDLSAEPPEPPSPPRASPAARFCAILLLVLICLLLMQGFEFLIHLLFLLNPLSTLHKHSQKLVLFHNKKKCEVNSVTFTPLTFSHFFTFFTLFTRFTIFTLFTLFHTFSHLFN
jgi:hypothetical protein